MSARLARRRRQTAPVRGPGESFSDELSTLTREFPDWWSGFDSSDVVYAIPQPASIRTKLRSILDADNLDAETRFADLCWRHGYVGISRCVQSHPFQPIMYSPLRPTQLQFNFDPDLLRSVFGATLPSAVSVERVNNHLDSSLNRLLGIAGYLKTEPDFLREMAEVHRLCNQIPIDGRPSFPITRPARIASRADERVAGTRPIRLGSTRDLFENALAAFLEKWCLAEITTWDWVLPQGPLVPDLLSPGAGARPQHGIGLWLPAAYPLTGDDDLLRKIRQQQRGVAEQQGIPLTLVALQHHDQYAQMARVMHLETTLRSRFPERRPKKFVTNLIDLAGDYLGVNVGSVTRLRKWISRCQRGHRHKIKALQVRG